jgi:energy-coupling factor transporter ATP-binding protein EcfA2
MIGQRHSLLAPYSSRILALDGGRLTAGEPDEPRSASQPAAWGELWKLVDAHGPPPSPVGLSLRGLSHRYRGSDGFTLGPIDAEVDQGEVIALVGANGSGKSTLFKLILGALKARSGTHRFVMPNGTRHERVEEISLGVLFQNPSVQLIGSTVAEEIMGGRGPVEAQALTPIVDRIIELFPFLDRDRDPLELSFGQQKVLCLLGLSIEGRGLVLLDEPEQGLDENHLSLLRSWFDHVRRERRQTLFYATHDMDLAADCADRVWVFSDGLLSADLRRPTAGELLGIFHAR